MPIDEKRLRIMYYISIGLLYLSVLHVEAKGSAQSAQSFKFFLFSPVSISGQDTILFLYKEIYKHLAIINLSILNTC